MKSIVDVVLVGRPDHSMLIYNELLNQEKLTFKFVIFKVLPHWCKYLTKNFRVQYVRMNCLIGIRLTILSWVQSAFKIKWISRFSEKDKLARAFNSISRKNKIKLVHYWGCYANQVIEQYGKDNPDTIILKDIHMPCYRTVLEVMEPVCLKYNMPDLLDKYKDKIAEEETEFKNVTYAVAPSEYVANSFKKSLSNIRFYIVPYGIMRSGSYHKHQIVSRNHRFKFVYAGSISIQKGCDLLMDYFAEHQEFELHLYGQLAESQSHILLPKKTDNVFLHGVISKNKLQQEFLNYDIGIHLSRFDAYSLAVGEEIGSGLPVIVSSSTGIESDVRRYKWGLVTDAESSNLDELVKEITNPDIYNIFANSIDRYLNNSHPSFGKKMISFYETLLNEKE